MKIKLDKPVDYTSSISDRSMSIGNKNLGDSDQRGNSNYMNIAGVANNSNNRVEEVDNTPRVDRVEASNKTEKINSDYTSVVKQRNEKLNQYRKEFISKTATESDAKSNVKREQAKQELVAKLSSSSDNIKRVQQEFNDSKEKLTTKIHEQNDSTAQAQSKLRDSKRQLLSEIQKTSDANSQVKQELQQNQRELTSKNMQEVIVTETKEAPKEKTISIEERKTELVKKVIENTGEDAAIKQKLAQYKRELTNATNERQQLTQETKEVELELEEYSNQEEIIEIAPTTSELEKIRDTIKEQEINKNINELLVLNLDSNEVDLKNELVDIDVKVDLPKVTKSVESKIVEQPKSTKKSQKEVSVPKIKVETPKYEPSNVTSFNSYVTPVDDYYEARNLTAIDISLLSSTTAMSYSSNVTDISNEISTVSSSTSTSTSSIDAEKQAIISKIAVDTSETTEIQQKLREYQAEVRRINSEILSLADDSSNTNALSYQTYQEASEVEDFSIFAEELSSDEAVELIQIEQMLESISDIEEVEVIMSAQEELNSVIKLIATEIKQDELLAKINEQEQAIARNKILEKRESLIELAKQNNELLRTLNQRLAIITKKAVRKVVYSPTIISQKNKMSA